MNRRELLKFFGAGTIIAPLSVDAPLARIIEPPKIELFKSIPEPIQLGDVLSATLTLTTPKATHVLQLGNLFGMGAFDPSINRLSFDLIAYIDRSPARVVGKMYGVAKV